MLEGVENNEKLLLHFIVGVFDARLSCTTGVSKLNCFERASSEK